MVLRRYAQIIGVVLIVVGFRLVYADHRGLGCSDKPHDAEACTMGLRVADAVAVLDELGVQRAHFVGTSWGGRLGFGIGEYAPSASF